MKRRYRKFYTIRCFSLVALLCVNGALLWHDGAKLRQAAVLLLWSASRPGDENGNPWHPRSSQHVQRLQQRSKLAMESSSSSTTTTTTLDHILEEDGFGPAEPGRVYKTEHGKFGVGPSGMLYRARRNRRRRGQLQQRNGTNPSSRPRGPGYQPYGGALPTSSTFFQRSDWSTLDNTTCLNPKPQPALEWQTRAPALVILGTMKGGTQALTSYLWQHPQVVRKRVGMEIHFFNQVDFLRTSQGIPQSKNQRRYAERFRQSHPALFVDPATRTVALPDVIAIDSTPFYLMASDFVPSALLCIAPWSRWIALVRHPIERAESHFRYLHEARQRNGLPMVNWTTWVDHDISLLRQAGVLQDWTKVDFDEFSGSPEEFRAWRRYVRSPSSQQLLGRGLYAVQLEHYYAALRATGHTDARDKLLVLQSEELRTRTQDVYSRVLEFAGLPPHQLRDTREQHQSQHTAPLMPPAVREKLEELFRPYNRRLYKLLNWAPVWNSESAV